VLFRGGWEGLWVCSVGGCFLGGGGFASGIWGRVRGRGERSRADLVVGN